MVKILVKFLGILRRLQIISQIRGKCKKVIKPQFLINNEKVIQIRVIANEFNNLCFVSLASKLNKEVSFRS